MNFTERQFQEFDKIFQDKGFVTFRQLAEDFGVPKRNVHEFKDAYSSWRLNRTNQEKR